MSKDFQTLLRENSIKHEMSAPYSPHQNGTAERGWRTMFIESQLPKCLWNCAVQTAAIVQNRCFNKRTGKTPYQMLTSKIPDVSKMQKFGSECYTYKQAKGKLDSRCEQGLFVGYDKSSPAYLVYHPDKGKVLKHRLVKFVHKVNVEKQTQTVETEQDSDKEDWMRHPRDDTGTQEVQESTEKPQEQSVKSRTPKDGTFDEFDHEGPSETNN